MFGGPFYHHFIRFSIFFTASKRNILNLIKRIGTYLACSIETHRQCRGSNGLTYIISPTKRKEFIKNSAILFL
jgi:hypothetical protein